MADRRYWATRCYTWDFSTHTLARVAEPEKRDREGIADLRRRALPLYEIDITTFLTHCTDIEIASQLRTVSVLSLSVDLTICSAAEDITNSSQVQNALQDLVDIRHAKIRTGLHSMSMGPAPAVKVHLVYFVSFFYCLLQFLHLLTESAEWHFCHGA